MGNEHCSPHARASISVQRIQIADEHFSDGVPIPVSLKEFSQVDFACNSEQLMFIEIFAGTAVLSHAAREAGFMTLSFDRTTERTPKVAMTILDLTKESDTEVLVQTMVSGNIAAVHFAPPCGTASKAREKPLPASMKHIQADPLRSDEHLFGLPNVPHKAHHRLTLANRLYAVTLLLVTIAALRNIIVSVENPSGSYFWPLMDLLVEQNPEFAHWWHMLEAFHFQACMHGGDRYKWTCWYGTPSVFLALRQMCDGSHSHKKWTPSISDNQVSFPTAAEAQYPKLLCQRVVQCIVEECRARGTVFPLDAYQPQQRMNEQKIPGKCGVKSLPPIISEYKYITDTKPDADFKELLRVPLLLENGVDGDSKRTKLQVKNRNQNGKYYGVFRTPVEFVDAALTAQHPIDYAFPLPDVLIKAVVKVLEEGPALTNARRVLNLKKVQRLVASLQPEETTLHSRLPEGLAKVLKDKNLLAWKKLMEQTNFDDASLFQDMIDGFDLVGQAATSGEFPYLHKPALQSVRELRKKSKWMRASVIGKCKASDRPDLDEVTWTKTIEERDRGWLQGPFTLSQVEAMVGDPNWIVTRRFPLEQKDKVRMIDDCLDSGLNSAFSSSNKLQLMDVDVLVALVMCALKAMGKEEGDRLHLSTGEVLALKISPLWGGNLKLVGRTLDLEAAYKQAAPKPEQLWARFIVVFNPALHQPSFFSTSALMFGSTASVYAFNRLSRSLWHIQTSLFAIWSTVFYDDYPTVETEQTSGTARDCAEGLLRALGWKFATEGKKALPFADSFNVLGVSMHLQGTTQGFFELHNKPERVESLLHTVEKMLDAGKSSQALAASFQGQLSFAQGQFLGSELKPGMAYLSGIANSGWTSDHALTLPLFASYVTCVLRSSPPKRFSIDDELKPVLLFTDGAWEPTSSHPAGGGVVLVDPVKGHRWVAEIDIDPRMTDHWKKLGKSQLIAELELLPIAVSLHHFGKHLTGRRVLWFVDNNSVRDMLIKGSTSSPSLFCLLAECFRISGTLQLLWWVTRVPSKSNIADFPSRRDPQTAASMINGQVLQPLVCQPKLIEACLSISSFVDYMQFTTEERKHAMTKEVVGGK